MTKKIIIDVASYQSHFTVNDYKRTGASAAIIKLTEGTNYANPYAKDQINKVSAAGVKHIHFYHFQRATSVEGMKAEARFCIAQAKKLNLKGCYIFLDAELTNAVPSEAAVLAFYNEIRKAGFKAGFYTYQFMFPKFSKKCFTASDGVWVAAYPLGNKATNSEPDMNYFPSQENVMLWQFTDNWKGMNVDGSIDIDGRLFKGNNAPNKPTQEDKPSYYNAVLKRIRLKQTAKIYKDKYLNDPVRSYPKDTEFELIPEKPFKTKSGATRYKTESGYYITGNQDYVNSIYFLDKSYSGKKTIELKQAAYLYKDKYFKERVRKYEKGTRFNIVENVALSSGRRCFKTESGYYITANKDYSKFVK